MQYAEESHAKDLYRDLATRFASADSATNTVVEGAGVHWKCVVKRGDAACEICCFDTRRGTEYLTSFELKTESVACGRTESKSGTVDAVDDWLSGRDLAELYARFPFVDRRKRALESLRRELNRLTPELTNHAPGELIHGGSDFYKLAFEGEERSLQISFYGDDPWPNATFLWDGCQMFGFQADNDDRLADVAERWLCDGAMPSELRTEFPWLEISEVADYYERGNPFEGECVTSWLQIERFFQGFEFVEVPQILALIAEMRERGYDKHLRAGQSMASLIVSRSRRHGLREDQSSVAFFFSKGAMDVVYRGDEESKIKRSEIRLTPQVDTLLTRLMSKDVD